MALQNKGTPGVEAFLPTLADGIFDQLENAIVTGELPLGSKLREVSLAQRYGVSRGPLREALRRLEGRRLVEQMPRQGSRVITLDRDAVIQSCYVREALEGMACRLAAQNMTVGEIDVLERLLDDHAQSAEMRRRKPLHQGPGSEDFHYLVAQGSHTEPLRKLLCVDLYSLTRLCRYRTNVVPGYSQQAYDEHLQMVKAIRARDGELAEMLARRHVQVARKLLEQAAPSPILISGGSP